MEETVNAISSKIEEDPDSAYLLALDLLDESMDKGNKYGIVQSNFILAYIHDDIKGEYGKAIIYYLEAIRYAEKANYPEVRKNLISLHKNCGIIFRKFKSYSLAEEYYDKALSYASMLPNESEAQSINYNRAGLLMDQHRYEEAISLLKNLIDQTERSSKNFWKYNNRLGIAYFESENYELAIDAHVSSLDFSMLSNELDAYTTHNIGRCYALLERTDEAISHFNDAIDKKKRLEDKSSLFSSYKALGELSFRQGFTKQSLVYFDKAEEYLSRDNDIDQFELFKLKANTLFELKEFIKSKKYEDLYSNALNEYLLTQEEIQETDRRYNMDLITKRYFDEIDKQERIASILLYSKLTSGGLLTILLLVVGYNRYERIRLRKSISRELAAYRIIE